MLPFGYAMLLANKASNGYLCNRSGGKWTGPKLLYNTSASVLCDIKYNRNK